MTIPPTYHDSDADDEFEYERSIITSPIMPTDDENSPTDTDPPSTEPTPTAFGHHMDLGKPSPGNTIVRWTTDQCADYISSLSLSQYCETFLGTWHGCQGVIMDTFGSIYWLVLWPVY